MSHREDLIGILELSRSKMLEQLDRIDIERYVYPLWSVREILAHLSGWDEAVIIFISAIMAGQVPPTLTAQSIDEYNVESLAARKNLDYGQTFREYVDVRAELIKLLRDVPENKITAEYVLPWGSKGTIEDIVNIWGSHEEEHAVDVENFNAQSE